MRIPFFGKRADKSDPEEERVGKLANLAESDETRPVFDNKDVDLSLCDHVTVGVKAIGGEAYVDALIPMVAKAADAAAQWDHAIVRFPEGAGWNDLLNRKTPGWEEWKQLGILKEGKFQPQAAVRQAKLQPVAVANLALQGAAIVVGQAYMAEISKQLEGIESGIAAIQQEMRLEREADIEARFAKLLEYLSQYDEIATNSEKRQAVHNAIEGICVEALKAWRFQVKVMRDFSVRMERSKRLKDDEVRARLREFQGKERDAQTAFRLFLAAEQASMQYDGDFSAGRIAREREKIGRCLDDYAEVRSKAQGLFIGKIKEVRGGLFAIPDMEDDGYKSQNLVFDVAHFAVRNALRVAPSAMYKEAQERAAIKRRRYRRAVDVGDPIALMGEERETELARMDFIYNEADAMLIDGDGIHFLKSHTGEVASDVDGAVDECRKDE